MNIQPSSVKNIERGAALLQNGQLVAFPTETVYGLGADATQDDAVAAIFATKGRPQFNPLILHVHEVAMAQRVAGWNGMAQKLAERFWPGPLTLVLPRREGCGISLLASAGGDTLAIRMPQHAVALRLIEAVGSPVAAPSANRSGRVSPTTARHVFEELGESIPLILDAGPCSIGVESTVLDITSPTPCLLRPGGVAREAIERLLGCEVAVPVAGQKHLKSPGLLESHYAPSLMVRLNTLDAMPGEALLAFGPDVPAGFLRVINLSHAGDVNEAAARLFAALRELDSPDYSAIAVMPIPQEGLGLAINDRLARAAADRR